MVLVPGGRRGARAGAWHSDREHARRLREEILYAEHEPPPMNPLMREGIGKGEDGRGVAGVRDFTGEGLERKRK